MLKLAVGQYGQYDMILDIIEKLLIVFHYKHTKNNENRPFSLFCISCSFQFTNSRHTLLIIGHCMGLTSSGWQFPQRFVFCYKLCFLSFNPKRKARTYCRKDRKGVSDVLLICSVVGFIIEWNIMKRLWTRNIFLRELSYEQNRFRVIDTIGKMYFTVLLLYENNTVV